MSTFIIVTVDYEHEWCLPTFKGHCLLCHQYFTL